MDRGTGVPKFGVYHIRNVVTNSLLNLVCLEEGQKPLGCIPNATRSPTQKWRIEHPHSQPIASPKPSLTIRNVATSLYLARRSDSGGSSNKVVGVTNAFEWNVTRSGLHYHIQCSVNSKNLYLGFAQDAQKTNEDGNVRALRLSAACVAQKGDLWDFEEIPDEDEDPPSYLSSTYIGPLPPGAYWIGQPDGNNSAEVAAKAASAAGITVPARLPLAERETAPIHLDAVWKAPWPNQIWILEPGTHGYRLKNLGTNTYLTYLESEPVVQRCSSGVTSSSEWRITRVKKVFKDNVGVRTSYTISPLADVNYVLTSLLYTSTFNKIGVSPSEQGIFSKTVGYKEWRFESIDEEWMQYPALQA